MSDRFFTVAKCDRRCHHHLQLRCTVPVPCDVHKIFHKNTVQAVIDYGFKLLKKLLQSERFCAIIHS